MTVRERLREMGLEVPEVPQPLAAYVPGVACERLLFVSGQLPVVRGELRFAGKLGRDLGVEEGQQASRLAVLNCLGVVQALAGDLERVERIVKITGFIHCIDSFTAQPAVLNGASTLLEEVFGERGRHARAAVGVNALPLNAACEVEMIALLAP
jgi:enamine deaminase RidA (YjgF/YER057c/UK114 family)